MRRTDYLLKERNGDVEEFADAVTRVAAGIHVVDPEVLSPSRRP
ncbi:hypothetical protein [Streptomyces sp. NPDC029041]